MDSHVAHHAQNNGLLENWNRQLKHLLSNPGGDQGMRADLHAFMSVYPPST